MEKTKNSKLTIVDNFNEQELLLVKGGTSDKESRDITICIGANSGKGKEEPKKNQ